jgi:hypothetical protein
MYLIILIFYQSYLKLKKINKSVNYFLFIGAISSLTNAMFDFDWHFFAIFLLTLIFLALILRDQNVKKTQQQIDKSWKFYIFFLTLISMILFVTSILANKWQRKKPALWLKYAPFYNKLAKISLNDPIDTVETYTSLYDLYHYDTDFMLRFLNLDEKLDQQLELQLYLDLAEIDPASFASTINLQNWHLEDAKLLLDQLILIIDKHHFFDHEYFINYWRRVELAKQVFTLAQEAYKLKDWSHAAYFYHQAYFFDSYVFFSERAIFLDEENLDNFSQFLPNFSKFSPQYVGDFYTYMLLYRKQTTKLFLENRLTEFEQLIVDMLNQEPSAKWYLIDHLYNLVENEEQDSVLQKIEALYQ